MLKKNGVHRPLTSPKKPLLWLPSDLRVKSANRIIHQASPHAHTCHSSLSTKMNPLEDLRGMVVAGRGVVLVNLRWLRVQRETRDSGPGQQPSPEVNGGERCTEVTPDLHLKDVNRCAEVGHNRRVQAQRWGC